MISIHCTKCQTELTMDDAFAGGVCRCQHCGTIQTVPTDSATGVAKPVFSDPIHLKNQAPATTGQSSGLDDLANALGGSSGGSAGLSGSGFGSRRLNDPGIKVATPAAVASPVSAPVAEDQAEPSKLPVLPLAFLGALLVFAVIGVAVFLWLRGRTSQSGGAVPTFAGIMLNAPSVIYLIDNGSSTGPLLDPLKAACFKSLATLGPERKFQVMAWDTAAPGIAAPRDGMHNAEPLEIAACKDAFRDVGPAGNTHLAGALKRALDQHPSAIVIATGKWELDRDDAAALGSAAEAGVKIYTFGLGAAPDQGALKLAATATGGQYKHLSPGELSQSAE